MPSRSSARSCCGAAVAPELPDLEEATAGHRRRKPDDEDPTVEVDLGNGRKARFHLPQLPPGLWVVISLLMGGSGTAVGTVLSQDWLGLHAREEVAELRLQLAEQRHAAELAAIRCGCARAFEPEP